MIGLYHKTTFMQIDLEMMYGNNDHGGSQKFKEVVVTYVYKNITKHMEGQKNMYKFITAK